MKVMIVGDTHGDARNLIPKIEMAGRLGIQKVLQVGDFGLWYNFAGVVFLDEVQKAADKAGLTVHAIPGNHEWHDEWEHIVEVAPKSHRWAMVRSRIALAPKVHHWKWDNKQFVSAGGAVSVDREWRLQYETSKHQPRTIYFPNEELTDDDVHKVTMLGLKADYLITHDASNHTPFHTRLKIDPESETHRRRIDKVIVATEPELHFHGHFHTKYDWMNFAGEKDGRAVYVQTYGLEHDQSWNSFGILDTATDKFTWRDNEPVE